MHADLDPVEEQLAAYNARDIERFIACYAPDVVIEDGAGDILMQGDGALRERYARLFERSSNLRAEVITRIRVGSWAIDEERVSGFELDGVADERHVVAVYWVSDGLIARVRFLE